MSSHKLAIAKASFTAALLRPDPTSVSVQDIDQFLKLLNAAILQCSPPNIQKCKRWILESLAQSTPRLTALGKYLTTLTTTFAESTTRPSPARKSLHILYLLNDLLYHTKFHSNDASISSKVQPALVALFSATASFKKRPKLDQKVQGLLDIWTENGYYSVDYISKLREAVKTASETEQPSGISLQSEQENGGANKSKPRSIPFVMPAMHGDPLTPWYDLPAANLMPHIEPNSSRPIRPELVKPLQFVAGPADEKLATAVKDFLSAADEIYGVSNDDTPEILWDVDELGQQIHLDENGEVIHGEGYYGWSKDFCENMRKKQKGLGRTKHSRSRSRSSSMSRSESENGNRHSLKRRRRASDRDSDSSRSRNRSRRRSRSQSRRSRSRSRSRSQSRTRYGIRDSQSRRSRSESRSLSRPRSSGERYAARPEMKFGAHSQPSSQPTTQPYAQPSTLPPLPHQAHYSYQPMQSSAPPFPPLFAPIPSPYGQNGMIPPPPPPPPPGYAGTWPPPQLVPQPMPYGQPNQNWPPAPPFNAPWQPNMATPNGSWNGMQQQPHGDGRGGFAWNGAPPRPYFSQQNQNQNQGYPHGPQYNRGGRGGFRGRGRG